MELPPEAVEILDRLARFGIRPGLERIRELLAGLGDPQARLPTVLVAGTNGKGSTAALLASMVTAAGYRSGLYTSPHLESVRERVRVDGKAVDPGTFGALLQKVDRVLEAPPTYFEALTALALLHFEQAEVELAVLEVGLGGRLDATNLCSPRLSLITPVALDHQRHLGSSLPEIAREKAGILRPGVPALVGLEGEAERAVRERAARLGTPFEPRGELVEALESTPRPGRGQTVRLRTRRREYSLELALAGRHQAENLALAVLAGERLAAQGFERLDRRAIEAGVAGCCWPGRLERVELPGGRSVLLDGAHNPHAARTLARHLRAEPTRRELLFGVLEEKEVEGMLPPLREVTGRLWLTRPAGARGRDPRSYGELWREDPEAEVIEPASLALEEMLEREGTQVVVSGSLHLVGEVRAALRERWGVPEVATVGLFGQGGIGAAREHPP